VTQQSFLLTIITAAVLGLTSASSAAAQTTKPDSAQKPWWERITFGGDFRLRYDGIYDGVPGNNTPSRHRERFRLRLTVGADISEELAFGLRLASGDPGDPTSTNQSLAELLGRKPINIDQVFLTYSPRAVKGLTLGGGKYALPVTRTQMTWDDDVNWEGTYQQYSTGSKVAVRLVAAQSPITEVGGGSDAYMFAEYAHVRFPAGKTTIQLSIADYKFSHVDQIAVAQANNVLRTQRTNRLQLDSTGRVVGYVSGFNLVNAIGQATIPTPRREYPVTLLADWVLNTEAAGSDDTGVWLTGSYGRASALRSYSAGYTFAWIEQDAAPGAFNFSDMVPSTNVRAHILSLSYVPLRALTLDLTAFFTTRLVVPAGASNPVATRILADARIRF
jgi:hypothetical protein